MTASPHRDTPALAPGSDPEQAERRMAVRFAVLGAGRIGQVHARALGSAPGAEMVAVACAAEIAPFVDAVTTGAPIPTTGHDGLMALALAEAAIRSVGERRAVRLAKVL